MENSKEQRSLEIEPPTMLKANVSFRQILEFHFGVKFPKTTELFIWSIGIVLVIALTAYGFVPLISEYRNNNVVTQVDVILIDHHFRPPQMVLVLPRGKIMNKNGDDLMILASSLYANNGTCGSEALEICERLKWASLDVWNGRIQDFNRATLETYYSSLNVAFIEKIFMNPNPLELFGDDQNEVVISSLWNFIGWVMMFDYTLTPTASNTGFDIDLCQKFENFDNKFEFLHNRILKFLCTRMQYTELDYPDEFTGPVPNYKTCSDLIVSSAGQAYIGWGLTVAFPKVETPTIKEYRFRIPQQSRPYENSSLLASVGSNQRVEMTIFADVGSLYTTVLDQAYAPRLFQTPSETRNVAQKITIKYKVQMRAREARSTKISCSNRTTTTTCFMQCTKVWIVEECKCVAFKWKKGLQYISDEKIPTCSPLSYTKCNVTVLPKSISDQCTEKCKRPCDNTIYTFQISYDTFNLQNDSVQEFSVKMVPLFDSFAEFKWIDKDTPEQFFSQLAGVGSFYLGFSGLSVVSVIIWFLDLWKRFKKREADKCENTRKAPEDAGNVLNKYFPFGSNEFCGTTYEKWLLELEATFQAKWRYDIEAIVEKKHARSQYFSV